MSRSETSMLAMRTNEEKRGSVRTCVGCREKAAPEALVRFVLAPDGELVPDLAGGAFGRGAWVHPRSECLARAVPRGFARSLATEVGTSAAKAWRELVAAADRRVAALLASASGAKKLVVGATAVDDELRSGGVVLVVAAKDARAAVESREVAQAVATGRAVVWGTKSTLGAATHRSETAIVGVLDRGLARALEKSIELSHTPEPSSHRDGGRDVATEE